MKLALLLQAYLCKLGFARFCNIKYTAANSAEADISNPYVHLTNVSIQRRGEEYNESHGNKWPLACLLAWLQVVPVTLRFCSSLACISVVLSQYFRSTSKSYGAYFTEVSLPMRKFGNDNGYGHMLIRKLGSSAYRYALRNPFNACANGEMTWNAGSLKINLRLPQFGSCPHAAVLQEATAEYQ